MAGKSRQKRDEALALALARGLSNADAARSAGLSPRTVNRKMTEPEFKRRVAQLRTQLTEQAVGSLADAAVEAVATLRKLLKAKSDTIRLGSSRAILENTMKMRESAELAGRLDELEVRLQEATR